MGQGRAKEGAAHWPLGLALTRGAVVTGGLDKGPLFSFSVLFAPLPTPRRGNGANNALSHDQEARHEAGMW